MILFPLHLTLLYLYGILLLQERLILHIPYKLIHKANACHYLSAEKKQLLECLKILENNKVLHNFDGLDDEDIEIKIHIGCYNEINEINICITSDTKFSLNDAKLCLTYPQKEIDKRKKDMEILSFYISKEFNTFLSYLDNEESE